MSGQCRGSRLFPNPTSPGRLEEPSTAVSVLVAAHRLDHRPARLLALAAGLRTRLHLGRVELVALGRTRLARLGAGRTGRDHERALVGDEVGREVAELRTV